MSSRKPKQTLEELMTDWREERLQLVEAVSARKATATASPPRWQGALEVTVDFPAARPPRSRLH
jgi:hypothetical protein